MAALNPKVTKRRDGLILMTWNPDTACFGYRFYRDGVAVAKGASPTQAETTFKAETDGLQHSYGLARALEQSPEEVKFPADPTPPVPPPTGRVDGSGLIRLGGTFSSAGHLDSYVEFVVDWEVAAQATGQKAPVFAYRNLGSPTSNEGWKPIFAPGKTGNPDQFVSECVTLKRDAGIDGVWIDNLNAWDSSSFLPFMRDAGPKLKGAGLLVNANVMAKGDDGSSDRAWYGQVAPFLTHINLEYWMLGRGGPLQCKPRLKGGATYADYWEGWIQNPKAIHDLGCKFTAISYRAENLNYCRASFLLASGPGDVFYASKASHTPDGPDPYDPVWTKAMGQPLDPPVNPNGPYVRRFEHGTVSVDPVKGTATIT